MKILVSVIVAMLCATTAMAAPFVNGDFEDPFVEIKTVGVPTGWTYYASSGTFVTQLEPGGTQLPGSHQWFQMYTTVTSSCVGGLYQTFDTVAGATYTIKGYAAAIHADMNARIGIVQGDWGGTVTWLMTTPNDSLVWNNFETPVQALGSSMTVVCEAFNDAPTAKVSRVVKFDSVMIPEPSSMLALLSGLPLLGFAIRRRK